MLSNVKTKFAASFETNFGRFCNILNRRQDEAKIRDF